MKQSSIKWLEDTIQAMVSNGSDFGDDYPALLMHIKQAKQMHKEEILDAFREGKWDGWQNHKLKAKKKEYRWTYPSIYYYKTFNAE